MNNRSNVSHSEQVEMTGLTLASTAPAFYGLAITLLIWLMSADILAQGVQNTLLPKLIHKTLKLGANSKLIFLV